MAMDSPNKPAIWVRTFRVGEGTVKQIAHTIRLLFETLSAELNAGQEKKEVPPLVFEKFCVLALCVAENVPALRPLQSLGISKSFHLYGARPALLVGKKQEFLTDWAVKQNLLRRNYFFSEEQGNYSLVKDIEESYPKNECPWDDNARDGLEDLAALVAAIHKEFNDNFLVALTSVASKKELQCALEAELELWFHDSTASVYKGLTELGRLTELSTPTENQLKSVNSVLSKTANFTAQVHIKIKLEEGLNEIYTKIKELADIDKTKHRCWRDLCITLNRPKSGSVSGLREIISTLRIAYATNRILRELLNLAGFKDKRSIGLENSLTQLKALLDNPKEVDPITRLIFAATDSEPDIATILAVAQSKPLKDFKEAFIEVRKLVLEIADRCERVLKVHGIDSPNELPELLEPPRYIMMWDIIGSTNYESRDKIEALIVDANQRIASTLGKRILGFHADSKDDSNSFTSKRFKDALDAFQILNEVFRDYHFRSGCEVNLQGPLNYYPKSKSLGGRAYDYTARVRDFFKEIQTNPILWSGVPIKSESELKTSYMVVGEFAKRYALPEGSWPESKTYIIKELDGQYTARVNASLPVSLTILQPRDFNPKGLENTGTHEKQPELIDYYPINVKGRDIDQTGSHPTDDGLHEA
jgi:hypothetical protein